MRALPVPARLYVAAVLLAASTLLVLATMHLDPSLIDEVLILAALYWVSESLSSRSNRDVLTVSLGSLVILAAISLVGMWGAVLVAWTSALAHEPQKTVLVKRAFNGGMFVVAAGLTGATYQALGGGTGLTADDFPRVLLPVLAADLVHCAVNGALVAGVVGLAERVSPVRVFQGTMAHSVLPYLGYGMLGICLAVLWDGVGVGPASVVLLLLPLFVARWAYAQYAEEQAAYDRTVRALMAAVETKDLYTRGHSERVSAASVLIGRRIGMHEDRVASLRYAGILHDVGKLGVPTRVLQKSSRLDDGEFEAIKRHPLQGVELVREIDFLDEAAAGILHHHERIDGLGYPMGLTGSDIPEFARVIAVADAFDSMTTTRSYRGARPVAVALEELKACAGTQFDPRMVTALVEAVEAEGWDPTTFPTRLPAQRMDEPFDQEAAFLDHDDPTASLLEGQA
jgi:HD-GYP domain-containing protein (c-di-GMP phosphodiesterase class II)